MKFQDIPQFPRANYRINIELGYIQHTLDNWDEHQTPLILNPEWQRGHVWTEGQKIAYMEYFLKGGSTGNEIYFNCSSWQNAYNTPIYCVDGLQRITAALDFLNNKIKVFGHYFKDYEDRPRMVHNSFIFNMLNIESKRELLKIYIDFNSGGTPHNPEEIKRVQKMIDKTDPNDTL